MELPFRVIRQNGTEHRIVGINRNDWQGLDDPCPNCGHHEFDHFTVSGGHYGPRGTAIIERTDFWDSKRRLFTRCRKCGEILYKHPAFDLLFDYDGNDDAQIEI